MYKCVLCYNKVNDLKRHIKEDHSIHASTLKEAVESFSIKDLEISNCKKIPYNKNLKGPLNSEINNMSFLQEHDLQKESFKDLLTLLETIHFLNLQGLGYHEMLDRYTLLVRAFVNTIENSNEPLKLAQMNEIYEFLKYHNSCNAGIVAIEILNGLSFSERLTEIMTDLLDVHKYNDYFDSSIQYILKYDKISIIPLIKKAKNCELRRTQYSGVLDVLGEKFRYNNRKWLKMVRIIIAGLLKNNYSVDGIFWDDIIDSFSEFGNIIIRNSINDEIALRKEIFLIINNLLMMI